MRPIVKTFHTAGCIALIGTIGCIPFLSIFAEQNGAATLQEVKAGIQEMLDAMDADLAAAADAVAQTGLTGDETRQTLNQLCGKYPDVVDCSTIDTAGIIVAVEPPDYHDAEGADISDQQQVITLQQTLQPVLSDLFMAVEGFPAVDLEWPVLPAEDELLGSVSMLIRHADFIGRIVEAKTAGTEYTCMVLQLDGIILYDADADQIGRNTFTDPMFAPYTELLNLAARVVNEPTGTGSYTFAATEGDTPVLKEARWDTVALHSTQWRVVLIKQVD